MPKPSRKHSILMATKQGKLKEIAIFLFFFLLTALMSYPLIFNLDKASDLGDPLFISWNLSWNVHKLFSDPIHLFDTNIFYPNKNTLAYSEHIFGLSMLAIPVFLITDNPIVSYNILILISFVFSGFGTYLLALHLTRNRFASIVAGIIFAFFPYRFFQLGHLHVLSTQWIPFSFLFLFRFFEQRDSRNMVLFLLFAILQILSSGSHAIYFSISAGITGLFLFIESKGYMDKKLVVKIIFALVISTVILLPFYIPYFENQSKMGFIREKYEIEYFSARIENYLASTSHLYYPLTSGLGKVESYLFPGIIPLLLSLIGILVPYKIKDHHPTGRLLITFIDIGIVISVFLILTTFIFAGIDINIFGLKLKSRNLLSPWIAFAILTIIRKPLNKNRQPFILSSFFPADKLQALLLILTLLAVSLSLGLGSLPSDKFYNLFYNYIPGFKFIRVPARIGMFVSFFLSLLSAYGIQRLGSFKPFKKVIFVIIPFILIEYASFPVTLHPLGETPEVHKWLEKEKGDFPVIELPIDNPMLNVQYVYYSTWHRKKLVNGYSGFFPPSDFFVREASLHNMQSLIDFLNFIKVKYVIVHREHLNDIQIGWIKELKDRLVFKRTFFDDDVYELQSPSDAKMKSLDLSRFKEIKPEQWVAVSDYNTDLTRFAFDGNLETRWHSGMPQHSGIIFTIDLHGEYLVNAVSVELGRHYRDYPRGLALKSSSDGILWEDVRIGNNVLFDLLCSSINTPNNVRYTMVFQPVQTRYLNLTLSGEDDIHYWSIPEIKVFSAD